jgi:hypothetical protein
MKSGNEGNDQRMDCWYRKNRKGRFFPGKVVVGSILLAVCIIFCFSGTYAGNDGDAWDQLKTALENVSADQLKPLKDVLGDGISPSQLLDGMRAIDAILAGDWTKAGENSAELVIGLFSSTFGGYLNIHKAAREATKAVIENWVQDLYDHPAYKGVVDVLNQHIIDSAKAKNPYLPSYLCGSHPSLRNNMLERETGMYKIWVDRPGYDVEDLVTGRWASRIRQATGRAGLTERQVFNALLVKAVEDQRSFILTTFQRVTMESAAGEVRANLGHKARTILAQIDAASQDEIGVGSIIATRDTFDGPLLGESAEVGDILAFQVERIGTWDEGHIVEWLVNGQTYKKEPASDSKIHLLRFDSEPLSPGHYRVVVLALADNQVMARQEAEFVLKDEFTVTELPGFEIRSFFDEPGGKPLGPYTSNGDTVAFSADIEHPLFEGEPKASEVFWQLYDQHDQPVHGVSRRYMVLENGTVKTYVFKFLLNNLEPGLYKVGATHYLLEKQDFKSQASTCIEVFDAAIIEGIVVTDHPGGKTHETFLTNDKLPHIYVYYRLAEGIAGADAAITVTDADTGAVLASLKAYRPSEKQYFGIRLEEGIFKKEQRFKVEARVTTPDNRVKTAESGFYVGFYQARLSMKEFIASGETTGFAIQVPDVFEQPFQVDLSPSGPLVLHHSRDALSGTATGLGQEYPATAHLDITVRDARNRVARGSHAVNIGAGPKPVKASTASAGRGSSKTGSYEDDARYSDILNSCIQKCKGMYRYIYSLPRPTGSGPRGAYDDSHCNDPSGYTRDKDGHWNCKEMEEFIKAWSAE